MKRWYVAQVHPNYEDFIKKDLTKRIQESVISDLFGQILIPSAKNKSAFSAFSQESDEQQLFPGYLLVEMEALPEAIRLVTATPRVIRFLGGKDPAALSSKEVERIISQVEGRVVIPARKSEFEIGKEVEISDGPFTGFVGMIDSIDDDNERLTVMVSIFGRMTPVELGFDQVKR